MKKSVIIFVGLFLFCLNSFFAQTEPPEYVTQLAEKEDLEVVYGNAFPYINPYGCSGSPVIKGILFDKDESLNKYNHSEFIVFLARKKIDNYDSEDKIMYLINNFEYYLIFAKYQEDKYRILEIHENLLGGLNYLWDSNIDIRLSEFSYLSSPNTKGPNEITTKDLVNKPIIMNCDSSMQYFVYYNGKWLTHIKRDW